ncbi:glycosyltransferase family 2 protein, partial [Pseudonocardia pini]|uniref:glycosyltransferase family 2 protein n=1 Tax=Pseudonocardia pini TaxID=2758030 RepID=UPI0015F08582
MNATGTATIVIPCYTEDRWASLTGAIDSALGQTVPVPVIVVVDHNPGLAARLRREVSRVTVLENRYAQGVSGGRNTGAEAATTEYVAFLDDDSTADDAWVERLVAGLEREPGAAGAGGAIVPTWTVGEPGWFPEEFGWAVGMTPKDRPLTRVRNVWGGNMMVRRSTFLAVGGFSGDFGKVGDVPEPEDTELCLRMNNELGLDLGWVFVPAAIVHHGVSAHRSTFAFFLERCFFEGAGKAALASRPDQPSHVLGAEGDFVRHALTGGVRRSVTAGQWSR